MRLQPQHSIIKHFPRGAEEEHVKEWAESARRSLPGPVTFALVFADPAVIPDFGETLEVIRIHGHVPVLAGCSTTGAIRGDTEVESLSGFTVSFFHLPETRAHAVPIRSEQLDAADTANTLQTILRPFSATANSWLLFASAQGLTGEGWLAQWDRASGGGPTIGGFAGIDPRAPEAFLFHNETIYPEGAVALALEGRAGIEPIVTQACRPVGLPWPVTEAEGNVIHRIGNRPILEVLRDTLEGMTQEEQKEARGNIFVGLVLDEYKSDFTTGDFLVRNLAAIDPKSGAVAIATPLRIGQNLQFQIRDARTASTDLENQLQRKLEALGERTIYGACLCNCIGRGESLYGVPDHDVATLREQLPGLPVSGLFCNGEFGPIGGRTRLQAYTASLALFVDQGESEATGVSGESK